MSVTREKSANSKGVQQGRGALDGVVIPLRLRLHTQMLAHLVEGDLDLPALHEVAHDLQRL